MSVVRCGGLAHASEEIDAGAMGPTLTRREREAFASYVKHLTVLMRLAEFEPVLLTTHCEPGYLAEVETDFRYHKITIALCPGFHGLKPSRQRTTLVHELLHAHARCMKLPFDALESVLARDVWATTEETGMAMEEHVVTGLESAMAHKMPLPPRVKRR